MNTLNSIPRQAGRVAALTAALLIAFGAGWASAAAPFVTKINTGLVTGVQLGRAEPLRRGRLRRHPRASQSDRSPNPVFPQGYVQMDVALDTQIPAVLGVFTPTEPCRKLVQLEVQNGVVTVAMDELSDLNIVTRNLPRFRQRSTAAQRRRSWTGRAGRRVRQVRRVRRVRCGARSHPARQSHPCTP